MFKGMFQNPIPADDPRSVKARARYDGWRQRLATMRAAIKATETRRRGAEDVLRTAAEKALASGQLPEISQMIQQAAATMAVCDQMLPVMQKAYRTESRRDLSPEPRVIWRPKRLHDAPGGAILSGEYQAHYLEG